MDSMKKKVLNALTSVYKENYENLLYLIDRSISDKSMRVLLRIYDEIERCMLKFKKMRYEKILFNFFLKGKWN